VVEDGRIVCREVIWGVAVMLAGEMAIFIHICSEL
jgi:hypothetical protein